MRKYPMHCSIDRMQELVVVFAVESSIVVVGDLFACSTNVLWESLSLF